MSRHLAGHIISLMQRIIAVCTDNFVMMKGFPHKSKLLHGFHDCSPNNLVDCSNEIFSEIHSEIRNEITALDVLMKKSYSQLIT